MGVEGHDPSGRAKLLFLCQTLPFPPDGGVQIRSFNILRLLAIAFHVTALFFYRQKTRPSQHDVDAGLRGLRDYVRAEAFPIPHERNWRRLVWDHLRSVTTLRTYTYYTYQSSGFERRLAEILAHTEFDLVHLDSLDLSRYLPMMMHLPVACTHHNIESDLLRARAQTHGNPAVASYLRLQGHLTEAEERRWCPRVRLNVTVSDSDARRLETIAPGAQVITVPNGVDTTVFQPGSFEESGIVFVGGHGWFPNRDAMLYFAERILPLIREQRQDVKVTWVGRAPSDVRREYDRRYGIRMTGYLEDIRSEVQSAACYVVPIRAGGGTRLKILDAWAMGKAVVSTSVGCEGLEAKDGWNILIRNEPAAFAKATLQLLHDSQTRAAIGEKARLTVAQHYDWGVVGDKLLSAYRSLLRSPYSGNAS